MVGIWSVDWRFGRRWEEGRREGEKKVWAIKNGQARKKTAAGNWRRPGHMGRHLPCSSRPTGASDQRPPPNWKPSLQELPTAFPFLCSLGIPELIRVTKQRRDWHWHRGPLRNPSLLVLYNNPNLEDIYFVILCSFYTIAQGPFTIFSPNRDGGPCFSGAGCVVWTLTSRRFWCRTGPQEQVRRSGEE
jgi:hypothetical protein